MCSSTYRDKIIYLRFASLEICLLDQGNGYILMFSLYREYKSYYNKNLIVS